MNPSEIRAALETLGGKANKALGQHFLIDRQALLSIVNAAALEKGDHVLEVGPGLGVLTRVFLERGVRATAIEQDRRMIEFLHEDGLAERGLSVVYGDAARLDWMPFVEGRPWKFVSNLPYSITSLALRKALYNTRPPERIVVLIQREVAERAIARDEKTSLLSLMIALASSEASIVRRVPAGAFFPPPRVESAVLKIVPLSLAEREKKWGIDPEKVMEIAKKGFAHPRKLLASNLGLSEEARKMFGEIGLSEKVRAEDVAPAQWVDLAKRMGGF